MSRKLIFVLILIAVVIAARLIGIGDYLTFESLKTNKILLQRKVETNYPLAVALFVLIYISAVALSVPGATMLTLSGGFLFGALWAALYVNLGATIGAALVFLLARYLIGEWFQKRYSAKLDKFNQELSANGYSYLLTLRLIPLFPFFLINILAGLTKIPLRTFVWTTAIGILPGSFVYTYAGSQLNNIDSPGDILSPGVLLAFVLLGLLALLPATIKKIKAKVQC